MTLSFQPSVNKTAKTPNEALHRDCQHLRTATCELER